MTPAEIPYLCGGTFFCLILQARKPRTKPRDRMNSGSDGLSEKSVMMGLVNVVTEEDYSSYEGDSIKKATSNFKTCQKYGNTYIPFKETNVIESFTSSVEQKNSDLLMRMSEFIDKYISNTKAEWLVKALLETVQEDNKIKSDTVFSISRNESITKQEIDNISEVELPMFLLSVLCFILNNRKDNTKGRPTFEAWHTKTGHNAPWRFTSDIGNSNTKKILVKPTYVETNASASNLIFSAINRGVTFNGGYSKEDQKLLHELTLDYDDIMAALIKENYGSSLLNPAFLDKIQNLYTTKWSTKANSFDDPSLKSSAFGLLGELNNICSSFTLDNPVPVSLPRSRMRIRNLYVRLHSDSFPPAFPYDAFIDDWDEGEY